MRIPRAQLLLYSAVAGAVIISVLLLLGWLVDGLPLVLDIAVHSAVSVAMVYLAAAAVLWMRGSPGR